MNINKAIIAGRIVHDLDLKVTQTGTSVLKVRVATNSKRKDKAGALIEDTQFHNLVMFGRIAEVANQYMQKGQIIFVTGKIVNSTWEHEGKKYYKSEILVDEMQMGERPRGASAPAKPYSNPASGFPDSDSSAQEKVAKDTPF